MAKVTGLPMVVQPNAGLPKLIDGSTVFEQTPETMATYAIKLLEVGAWIIGGCCGTTPEHIRAVSQALRGKKVVVREKKNFSALTSRSRTIFIGDGIPPVFVGERINPTARKKLAEDIREGRMNLVLDEARGQVEAGAPILDVNMGVPGIDEPLAMKKAVLQIQAAVDVPLSIDSANPEAIEAGLKAFAGKALINSVNGEEKSLRAVLPLARRYGAAVLGLTLDEAGIPARAEERLNIARSMLQIAQEYGIAREDVYIDCLVQTASAQQSQVMETLRGVQLVKKELGVKTMLGVSNVSYGLPAREILNSTFLAMALGFGLDLPIINPFDQRMRETLFASAVLTNQDRYCVEYIQKFRNYVARPADKGTESLAVLTENKNLELQLDEEIKGRILQSIVDGNRTNIQDLIKQALEMGVEPLALVNEAMIPGIEEVGKRYEDQTFFLPQLILGAETMRAGFDLLRPLLSSGQSQTVGKIVLATVQGDIHDIGKNIVAIMLENYGFQVFDLGKDVPTAQIIEIAEKEKADLIGLSALMTTTMPRMAEVVAEVQKRGLKSRVLIGGAVVTPEYAEKIGADAYAADARAGVLRALELVGVRVNQTT
jgi:5-methyltetrahydrofolate--homocysteine methyltransferase